MRSLLDVNVLIALLDPDHIHHAAARTWLRTNGAGGWASCPITQNGCVRIMSLPNYPNNQPVSAITQRLAAAASTEHHAFWPDDVSLLDAATANPTLLHGSRQVTDAYLLALAVRHEGRLVTFDKRIDLAAIRGAGDANMEVLA